MQEVGPADFTGLIGSAGCLRDVHVVPAFV